MPNTKLPPIHPGEILREEFLTPLGLSQYRLAKNLSVPPRRINEIVKGLRSITADTALRLSRCFGTSERFWLNLQSRYDLEVEKDRLGDRLEREVAVFVKHAGEIEPKPQSHVPTHPRARRRNPRTGRQRGTMTTTEPGTSAPGRTPVGFRADFLVDRTTPYTLCVR